MSKTKILPAGEIASIVEAADILRKGGIVAFPTETVYGLGADALDPIAVAKVFEAKRRPSFDPLIVHVSSLEEARRLWKDPPQKALDLARQFWPGPLTIVLPKSELVPDIVTAGLSTVAVRVPDHSAALELLRTLGKPIAAPSANLFGHTSPTTALAVEEDLEGEIDLILDGGETPVGVESTVVKFEGDTCVILRPGGTSVEELEVFVPVDAGRREEELACESPGLLAGHYAPRTPFHLMDKSYPELLKEASAAHDVYGKKNIAWEKIGLLSYQEKEPSKLFEAVEVLSVSGDLREAASRLFSAMRKLDRMGLDLILAEPVPEKGLGLAIMDRMRRAASGRPEAG